MLKEKNERTNTPETEDEQTTQNLEHPSDQIDPDLPEEAAAQNPEPAMENVSDMDTYDFEEKAKEKSKGASKLRPHRKKIVVSVAVLALVGVFVYNLVAGGGNLSVQASNEYVTYTVEPRDITLTLSGTGTLEPADSYTVTTLIEGEILSAPFEDGEVVEKDAVLYRIDSSDVSTSIEQAELSVEQSQRNYQQSLKTLDDLTVTSNEAGQITKLHVEVGDDVVNGQTIATIRNSATMSLEIYFGSDDVETFYLGQSAQVTLDGSFETLTGTISKISSVEERLDGNMLVRNVTIEVSNPGGIASGQSATAMVGSIACTRSGNFAYKAESTVTASASGTVSRIHALEGATVSKNQAILTLTSDSVTNQVADSSTSLRNSQLSLQSRYDQLDNYTITSPIGGTIIQKNYKEGDTIESGKPLCIIYDLSYLTMTLYVDELDISDLEVGQPVTITAEAVTNRVYDGYVTKININGTTTNGTTSYPVEIRIDDTEGLLPGMNVQAEITVNSKTNVLAVPVSALSRGNRVLVQSDEPGAAITEGADLPEGFTYAEVTPGISDGNFIEITSGLSQGDVVTYIEDTSNNSFSGDMFVMNGGMDMNSGAMPSGGGGMPNGGSGMGGMP